MSYIEFKDCDLVVGSTGILAENASVQMTPSLQPSYILGYQRSKLIPNGNINSTINFNYIYNVKKDPFFPIINTSRTNNTSLVPIKLEVAGLKFTAYLQSFNLNISPNNLAVASVGLVSFQPNSGEFSAKRGVVSYERNLATVGHSWTTFVTSSGSYLSVPTYNFSYVYTATYNPIFKIGQLNPIQVYLSQAEEEVEITRDEYVQITFSGDYAKKSILSNGSEKSLEINNIMFNWEQNISYSLSIDLRDAQVNSTAINAAQNEIVKVAVNIKQQF